MTLTRQVNGETVQLTEQEESDLRAEWAVDEAVENAQSAVRNAFGAKRQADIAGLGTRDEMRVATASSNNVQDLKVRVAQLEEIIYSMVKGTIE